MMDSNQRANRQPKSAVRRRGAIAILAALYFAIVVAVAAIAINVGYVMVAKTDLQRAADAAAHAAVLEYRNQADTSAAILSAREMAGQYVEDNEILNSVATLDSNSENDPTGDTVVGRIDFENPRHPMTYGDTDGYNAIRVRIRRTATKNGEIPFFFAGVIGDQGLALEAKATAAIVRNVRGFKIPGSGDRVPFLPITIREDQWAAGLAANRDVWAFDSSNGSISAGPDGIPEFVLYPNSTGSSGNHGTLNVGTSSNSTSRLGNQIRNGLSQSDLDYHGGELALDGSGKLMLSGNPGISAGIKDNLQAIAGKPVIIPIYRSVSGNGNNARFIIVKFIGVRVMEVHLKGGNKYVLVQSANVTFGGVLQAALNADQSSEQIYSPPILVQ